MKRSLDVDQDEPSSLSKRPRLPGMPSWVAECFRTDVVTAIPRPLCELLELPGAIDWKAWKAKWNEDSEFLTLRSCCSPTF